MHGDGVSGVDGTFRVGGLGDRPYELRCVETPALVGGTGKSKGGEAGVELLMRKAAAPTLTFTDEDGASIRGALVRVRIDKGGFFEPTADEAKQQEVQTDAKGQVRIRGLDPQVKYLLTAFPPTGRSELLSKEIKDWVPKDTSLVFEVGRRIAGVIRDQDKVPIAGGRLEWSLAGGPTEKTAKPNRVTADGDGRFAIEKLPPGSYRLLALRPVVKRKGTGPAPAEARDASKPVTITGGREDVSLTVRMPDTITLKVWSWDKSVGKPAVLISAVGDEGRGPKSMTKRLDKNGILVAKGLRWNVTYAIWMPALKHGKYVYEPELRPRDEKFTTTLKDGKTLVGRIEAPKNTKSRKVWAVYPGFTVVGKMKSGGNFEIKGLPPGPWTLRACGKLGKDLLETEGVFKPDAEPVIKLEPK